MSSDFSNVVTVVDTFVAGRSRLLGDLLNTSVYSLDLPEIVFPWIFFPNTFPPTRYGSDGHEVRDEESLVPSTVNGYRMYAGGRLTLDKSLSDGQRYMKISSIDSVVNKEGRSGTLTFIDVIHDVVEEGSGTPLYRDIQNLVYLSSRKSPRKIVATDGVILGISCIEATESNCSANFVADASMLFRYSALTYNGHKIHLDREYSRGVESLPGLVVHGPLLATVGATIANQLRRSGESIVEHNFRLHSTLFEGESAAFSASRDGSNFSGSALCDGDLVISFEGKFGSI